MAKTLISAIKLVKDAASANLAIATGTVIAPADTMQIVSEAENSLVILVNNTAASAKIVTFTAGDFLANGQGDLTVSVGANEVKAVTLTSMRFKDSDGYLNIGFESGMTGFVKAIALP